jgi:hypothetical protein
MAKSPGKLLPERSLRPWITAFWTPLDYCVLCGGAMLRQIIALILVLSAGSLAQIAQQKRPFTF